MRLPPGFIVTPATTPTELGIAYLHVTYAVTSTTTDGRTLTETITPRALTPEQRSALETLR